jgi:hypothetical protein
VSAIDAAGNESGKAIKEFVTATPADTQAPSVPADLNVVAEVTTAEVTWTASTDNVGVAGYNVYLDNVLVATITTTSYKLTDLKAETTFTVSVSAIDASGNESEKAGKEFTTKVSDEKTPDTEAPSMPTELTFTVTQTTADLNWNASTDNVEVTGYKVYVNNLYIATVAVATYQLTDLTAGITYTIGVSAIDAAGNESAIASSELTTEMPTNSGNFVNKARVAVYPNPVVDRLTVEIADYLSASNVHYAIFTVEGRLVLAGEITLQQGFVHEIDTKDLVKGIYLLRISGAVNTTIQIVKK